MNLCLPPLFFCHLLNTLAKDEFLPINPGAEVALEQANFPQTLLQKLFSGNRGG
jgi:hypothetical protein